MRLWRWVVMRVHHNGVEEAQRARRDAARRLAAQQRLTPRVEQAGDRLSSWVQDAMRPGAS